MDERFCALIKGRCYMNDPQGPPIRAAVAGDARVLSDLAFRSKAHWGYDAAFMEACREDLRVSEQDILTSSVYVHEHADRINGFYQLRPCGDQVEMVALFVEPRAMGHGIGKALWHHAMGTAKELGCDEVILQSEPHAAGFYRAMGATHVGQSPSTVFPGRMLPLMRFPLISTQGPPQPRQ